jgi:hypothetical protein
VSAETKTVTLSPIEWAEIIRDAQAQALRGAALYFEREMASAWGGDAQWLTTGSRVAAVVGDVLRELEAELASGGLI